MTPGVAGAEEAVPGHGLAKSCFHRPRLGLLPPEWGHHGGVAGGFDGGGVAGVPFQEDALRVKAEEKGRA
mgnify:CR=1 FL=1